MMNEGAVKRRHAGGACVYHHVTISGSGEGVCLCLAVDKQGPEQSEQERSTWSVRVLSMHVMGNV